MVFIVSYILPRAEVIVVGSEFEGSEEVPFIGTGWIVAEDVVT